MSVIQGSCCLSFVFKCILFFILHNIVINYVYKKRFGFSYKCLVNYRLHYKYLYTILLLIWQENFIQMYFLSAWQNHHPLHLWLNANTIADVQNVRVCMHVCTRGGGMRMVCCDNPEGLRLPVI